MKKFKAGVVGATGMVGQRFICLLKDHPWFEIVSLSASERSAGLTYEQAVQGRWKLSDSCPDFALQITVQNAVTELKAIASQVDVIFCALDMDKSEIRQLEEAYAEAGVAVISNNSAHRWTDDVPMIIPEVNSEHSKLIDLQRQGRGWDKGLIAVKPNCSIQSYTIVLEALRVWQPLSVSVTSLQAVSGAGKTLADWPEITDNVIPYIDGEEAKSEREPLKINGQITPAGIELAVAPDISATCLRVAVSDGHLADVSVKFGREVSEEEILAAFSRFGNPLADLKLPSSPEQVIAYSDDSSRPQPRLDRSFAGGMGVTVGRLRQLPTNNPYDWRFISMAHNTIRGAAGGAILMAELLVAQGYIV